MNGQPERTELKQSDGSINGGDLLREVSRLREWLQTLEEIIRTATRITPIGIGRPRLLTEVQRPPAQSLLAPDRPIYRLHRGEPRFPELSDGQILAMAAHLNLEANPLRSIQRGDEASTIYRIGTIRKHPSWMALFPLPTAEPHLIGATPTEIHGRNQASALREYLFRVRVGIDEELIELDPDSAAYNVPDRYLPTTAVLLRTKTPIPWYVKLVEARTGSLPAHKIFCEKIAPEIPRLIAERSAHAKARDEQFKEAYQSVLEK